MPKRASTLWFGSLKPCTGDSVSGTLLGKNVRGTFIWTSCPQCGKDRLPSMNVQNIIARQDRRIAQLESHVALLEADNTRLESVLSGGRDSVPDNHESKAL
jgi:hypothetical protein